MIHTKSPTQKLLSSTRPQSADFLSQNVRTTPHGTKVMLPLRDQGCFSTIPTLCSISTPESKCVHTLIRAGTWKLFLPLVYAKHSWAELGSSSCLKKGSSLAPFHFVPQSSEWSASCPTPANHRGVMPSNGSIS